MKKGYQLEFMQKKVILILISLLWVYICHSQIIDVKITDSNEFYRDNYTDLLIEAAKSSYEGDNDKAFDLYTKAINLKPSEAKGYNQRGHLKFKMKDFNGAIEDYTKFIELSEENKKGDGYANRGRAKMESNKYDEALVDFNLALSYYPNDCYTFYFQGMTYIKMGEKNKACESFSQSDTIKTEFWKVEFKKALEKYCK
jgi:tetratricopeptide (TPR) repeat protein